MTINKLLTIEEAAEYLSITPRMIRRLLEQKKLPVYRIGKHIRFAEADLEIFINSVRTEAESPKQ